MIYKKIKWHDWIKEINRRKEITYDVINLNDAYYFRLDDSSITRVLNHSKNGMMIISAFIPRYNIKENINRSKQLENDIRSKGLGFISSLGGYKYENEDEENLSVDELSYIVPFNKNSNMTEKEFIEFAIELCKKYNQESVLVSGFEQLENGNPVYLDKNANVNLIFHKTEVLNGTETETYYTKLKKRSQNNKGFTFKDRYYFGRRVVPSLNERVMMDKSKDMSYHINKYLDEIIKK